MSNNKCAPSRYNAKYDTCFGDREIIEMSKAYNRYIAKQKLAPKRVDNFENVTFIEINNNIKSLLSQLKKRFANVCGGDEQCISKQEFMNQLVLKEMREYIDDSFRPVGPADPKEWLGTDDINAILDQYKGLYPNFMFLGAVPLDCNDLSFCSLYKIDFEEYVKNNVDKLGVVFNLDKYGEEGSHWVGLYIDIKKGEIYFCDSIGKKPIENINAVIDSFLKYYKNKTGKDAVYKYNAKRYQRDGSECGVYSCNFIIRKLAGEDFESITENYLDFAGINSCRNVYFSNQPSNFSPNPLCEPKNK
uniref:Ubiquitin-like protease family profile domain-containing protein n=1 Tax=viral metagenome TaxID=1070528 RepID=A0A6C0C8M1_9ZZZZ